VTAALPLRSIGVVRSPVTEGVDEGWGDVVSELQLDPELVRGLDGLDGFSHALVVYYMHQSSFDAATDLVRRPRGRADMPELGIFAQRAKHRPNPVGITAVKIVARAGAVLTVRGLDAIDGTPLLDLKPYVPAFDRVDAPTVPAWMDTLMRGYF
jgi:tRNA-Thr(GGU) m(6)t(6)A37 methyltransferase TsaA